MNYIQVLRGIQLEIQEKLNYLVKNTLSKDNEEIYLILKNFNDSIIFLLDSKETTEILESKEIFNIIDVKNKKIKKCIMEFMYIELKSCEQCNFNQVCDWIKKETKKEIDTVETMNTIEKIRTDEENEALKKLLELEKTDNARLNMEIQELLRYVDESIKNISKIGNSLFSDGMTYILLQMQRMIESIY